MPGYYIEWLFVSVIAFYSMENSAAQHISHYAHEARGTALGQIQSVLTDHSAAYGNQAGLAGVKSTAIQLCYEYRWNNPELRFVSLNGILPAGGGVFSLLIRHFGYDSFREHFAGLAYARYVSSTVSLAGQIDLIHRVISGYGSEIIPTIELGWLVRLTDAWTMGFHCFNPMGKHREGTLPFEAEWGMLFYPVENIACYIALEKQTGSDLNQKIGIEYHHKERVFLRLGFSTQPGLFTFGTGLKVSENGFIDLASVAHQDLGLFSVVTFKYVI